MRNRLKDTLCAAINSDIMRYLLRDIAAINPCGNHIKIAKPLAANATMPKH